MADEENERRQRRQEAVRMARRTERCRVPAHPSAVSRGVEKREGAAVLARLCTLYSAHAWSQQLPHNAMAGIVRNNPNARFN